MEYLYDNILIIDNNLLNDKLFLFYLKMGFLKQFSFVVDIPKILVCLHDEKIDSKVKKFIESINLIAFSYSKKMDLNNFKKSVHFDEFDSGIYVLKNKNNYEFVFIGGSGENLSNAKKSILEKQINKYNNIVKLKKNIKKTIKNHKKSLKIIHFYYQNQKFPKHLVFFTSYEFILFKQKYNHLNYSQ